MGGRETLETKLSYHSLIWSQETKIGPDTDTILQQIPTDRPVLKDGPRRHFIGPLLPFAAIKSIFCVSWRVTVPRFFLPFLIL